MALKICITNDDGIHSEGLLRLVAWAQKLGEVYVYAPKVEQSAKSHAVEIHKAFEAKQVKVPDAVKAWAVDSTPADCVRFAVLGQHETFDLVISGVNKGLNIGQDIMYSGTCSAAMEAVGLGINALALSTEPETFDDAFAWLDHVWAYMTENDLYSKARLWNVNIPMRTTGELRITRQGGPYYSDDFILEENDMYRPMGKDVFAPTEDSEYDTDCVLKHRCISLTPLTIDRTDWNAFRALKK
nr:5'/3'-nucleotidase SurE [Clostridia bacterium]